MRTPYYSLDRLRAYFHKHLIATVEPLRLALGTPARATLFRMLAKTEALSSYSHRGKFYTLRSIAQFNAKGLWEYQQVRFCRFGNLLETLKELVECSVGGYSAKELEEIVGVKTKHGLAELVGRKRLERRGHNGVYIYWSAQHSKAREQQRKRKEQTVDLPSALLGSKSRLVLQEATKRPSSCSGVHWTKGSGGCMQGLNRPEWVTVATSSSPSSLASTAIR